MSKVYLHVKNKKEQNIVCEQLFKYCEIDTLAMVMVFWEIKRGV